MMEDAFLDLGLHLVQSLETVWAPQTFRHLRGLPLGGPQLEQPTEQLVEVGVLPWQTLHLPKLGVLGEAEAAEHHVEGGHHKLVAGLCSEQLQDLLYTC